MRIVDAHRLIGPIPTALSCSSAAEMLSELDHLGISAAAVTRGWEIFGDPRAAGEYLAEREPDVSSDRLMSVPLVIPGPGATCWPLDLDALNGVPLVRACPERHRFDALGASAHTLWAQLADRGIPLAVDAGEVGIGVVAAIARSVPGLKVFMLGPGYRELLRIVELLEELPGLFVETGTVISAGGLEWLARAVGSQRLVFGTGAPLWDDGGPRFQLDYLDLPADDVEMIAHGSWDRMIGAAS